jgi:hypothetical protein
VVASPVGGVLLERTRLQYPIHYPINWVLSITRSGLSLAPLGVPSATETRHSVLCPQLFELRAYQVKTNSRARPLKVGHAEARRLEDEQNEIDVRPRMFPGWRNACRRLGARVGI